MDSRERVALALAHQEPDRVPIDYWATSEIQNRLLKRFGLNDAEQLFQHFDVDFRYLEGPRYIGPPPTVRPDGSVEDHFGVPRVRVQVGSGGSYQDVIDFPLEQAETLDQVKAYDKWPSPDWFDYGCVKTQVAAARKTGKVVIFMGDRLNRCAQLKPSMYVRGIAKILEDLVLAPEIAAYLFDRIRRFYVEYARRTLEAASGGIDIFFTGDDFGTQNGLFMSPAMWRQYLRPGFKEFIDIGHEFGCKVAHHSCGSIKPIIADMIDCGLDILNPLQPKVHDMDPADLKDTFGDRLSFHGSICIQRTLPFGTVADVRREVQSRVETLARGGGFIFCSAHNFQADTPLENIEALFAAYSEYGKYH